MPSLFLTQHLPDMNSIVATWQSLLKNEDKDGKQEEDEKDPEIDSAVMETSNITEDHGTIFFLELEGRGNALRELN